MPGGARKGAGRKAGVPNKSTGELRDLAKEYTVDALKTLAAVMNNELESGAARVAAVNAILDRGYGKPKQTLGGDEENPLHIVTKVLLEAANGRHQTTT